MRASAACALACALAAPARAQEHGLFAHANLAVNAYTYFGSTRTAPSLNVTPADRVITFEQIGVGYFLYPELRATLTAQFGETWTGLPDGASHYTLGCLIPWLAWVHRGFFAGAGPMLAWRSGGKDQFDVGLFLAGGYVHALGRGFAIGGAIQAPMMFAVRFSVAVTPALVLAYRY